MMFKKTSAQLGHIYKACCAVPQFHSFSGNLAFYFPGISLEILQSLSQPSGGKKCIWQSQVFTNWWTWFCCRVAPVLAGALTGEGVTLTCLAQGRSPGGGRKSSRLSICFFSIFSSVLPCWQMESSLEDTILETRFCY